MTKKIIDREGVIIACVHSDEAVITDSQSILDLLADIDYFHNSQRIVINKEAIVESFFELRTGVAGEVLQKVVNYSKKIAIVGDFSCYTSKALKDFIYECNKGGAVFFAPDENTAIDMLLKT